jgi:CubicO group peptidase (beta-lactamase class C family)
MRMRWIVIGLICVAILAGLVFVVLPQLLESKQASTATYWPTQGWRESTPEEQGFDSAKLAEGLQAIQDRDINLDSLLVIRDGSVLLDAYFYPYDGNTVHDLASVTKSVMTTLIGIAIGQGKLKLDQPLISFFPDRTIANLDDRKEKITLRHLVSNTNGLVSGCIAGDITTIQKMMDRPDWVQAALDREMAWEPGSHFCYDSPGMHLLSAILQEATGMTALDFARQYLFTPLGIQEVIWNDDPQGYTRGWGDLHLKPRDAAKLGYLFLHGGVWDGEQIVPAEWVEEATKVQNRTGGDDDYGYGWWISEISFGAQGRGGQRVFVVPSLDALVVTTGGGFEYDDIDPYLTGALADTEKALPSNPEGVEKLKAVVAVLAPAPAPQPVEALPETARTVSGKTYVFGPNPAALETLRFEFNDPSEATAYITIFNGLQSVIWRIGLDGDYRHMPSGEALRGGWLDPQTFAFEIYDVDRRTYRVKFDGQRIEIASPEMGMRFEGHLENP